MPNTQISIADLRKAVGVVHRVMETHAIPSFGTWEDSFGKEMGIILVNHCVDVGMGGHMCLETVTCRRCLVNKIKAMMAECEK